jgi:uncharacterized protein with GYD domain
MPAYISLVRWSCDGIKNVKESPSRLEAAKKAYAAMGGKITAFYMVMGQYDMVVVGEVPNDVTAAKLALALGSKGSIRTETFRAFTEDEYKKIISELP